MRLSPSGFFPRCASLSPALQPQAPPWATQHVFCYLGCLKDILCLIMHPADRHIVTRMALRHASLCRYTAGVYSHIPGAMAALPKFDEGSDFTIPANVVKGDSDT